MYLNDKVCAQIPSLLTLTRHHMKQTVILIQINVFLADWRRQPNVSVFSALQPWLAVS